MATSAAASAFLSLPPPRSLPLPQRRRWASPPPTAAAAVAVCVGRCYSLASSASQASAPVIAEEDASSAPPASEPEDVSSPEEAVPNAVRTVNFSGCKACGREEIERGCNGEGRIQGGIATVPGFGWWPIKAFRPCPGFVASGGRYRRQGQSMDEVAFGRAEREISVESIDKGKSSKKKGAKKLKG